MQEGQWDVVTNDSRLLQQALFGGRQGVDARGEHRLHSGRDLDAGERPREAVTAARPHEHAGTDQRPHDLFDEERIAAGALRQEGLQDRQTRVGAQQGLKELRKALAGEGIQT